MKLLCAHQKTPRVYYLVGSKPETKHYLKTQSMKQEKPVKAESGKEEVGPQRREEMEEEKGTHGPWRVVRNASWPEVTSDVQCIPANEGQ
jgi:hypothetical protein